LRIKRVAPVKQTAHVIGADRIQKGCRVLRAHVINAHVRHVKKSRRVARGRCSSSTPLYQTGISQPAKGMIFPPKFFMFFVNRRAF